MKKLNSEINIDRGTIEKILNIFSGSFIENIFEYNMADIIIKSIYNTTIDDTFLPVGNIIGLSDFTGLMNGFIAVSTETIILMELRKNSLCKMGSDPEVIIENIFKAALNNVVDTSLMPLREMQILFTIRPPKVMYGRVSYPKCICYSKHVHTKHGKFQFCICIDNVKLDIHRFIENMTKTRVAEMEEYSNEIMAMNRKLKEQINERETINTQIEYMAYHDMLTGLLNKSCFYDHLSRSIALCNREKKILAVLYLNLDDFKEINDSYGHFAGDRILREVARQVQPAIRKADVMTRIGGDEFVILLKLLSNVEEIPVIAQKICESVSSVSLQEINPVRLTCSIGISLYPGDGNNSGELIRYADMAMNLAKRESGNNYKFFNKKLQTSILKRKEMKKELEKALINNEFELYYQPKININKQIIGMEALIRWNSPKRGLVAPGDFIPIAEKNGLIVQIGDWVMLEACRQNKQWQSMGFPGLCVSVNFSPIQLKQKDVLNKIKLILSATRLEARYLEIEVTETSTMEKGFNSVAFFTNIKDLGIKTSIDDFGPGRSPLYKLAQFPIDNIKIDKTFISQMVSDQKIYMFVRVIINMSEIFHFTVIAKGVETEEQFQVLNNLNCNQIQGYHFSKPLNKLDFENLLSQSFSQNNILCMEKTNM